MTSQCKGPNVWARSRFATQQFCSFWLLLFPFLLNAKRCNLHKLFQLTSFFNFEPNLYLQRRLLWVTWQANEQQCIQSSQQGFLYREHKIFLLFPSWKWCYTRWSATTIFSATQRCNIVATLFSIVTIIVPKLQRWFALKIVIANCSG